MKLIDMRLVVEYPPVFDESLSDRLAAVIDDMDVRVTLELLRTSLLEMLPAGATVTIHDDLELVTGVHTYVLNDADVEALRAAAVEK